MIGFIIGLCLGCLIIYITTRPKLKHHIALNEETKKTNEEMALANKKLEIENNTWKDKIESCKETFNNFQEAIENQKKQVVEASELWKDKVAFAEEQLANSLEKEAEKYRIAIEEYQRDYENILADYAERYQNDIQEQEEIKRNLTEQLKELKKFVDVATEAYKRTQLELDKKNFYRLVIPEEDLEEIGKLREVAKILRDAEPLNKVIWKVYYEKPYTDLAGRVIGKKQRTGIYKITNTINGMCYVGQTTSFTDRWRAHIKRGLGAETAPRNKLYPAMMSFGVENFTFEILEDCEASKLNEREKYWTQFYNAQEFGYSIRSG